MNVFKIPCYKTTLPMDMSPLSYKGTLCDSGIFLSFVLMDGGAIILCVSGLISTLL